MDNPIFSVIVSSGNLDIHFLNESAVSLKKSYINYYGASNYSDNLFLSFLMSCVIAVNQKRMLTYSIMTIELLDFDNFVFLEVIDSLS